MSTREGTGPGAAILLADIPPVGRVRAWLRQARTPHRQGHLADRATDLYIIFLSIVVLAAMLGSSTGRVSTAWLTSAPPPLPVAALLASLALLVTGAAAMVLAAVGPLFAGPATQTWLLSTPGDRATWLRRRATWLMLGCVTSGALLGLATAAASSQVVAHGPTTGTLAATTGTAVAVLLATTGIAAQGQDPRPGQVLGRVGRVLVALGVAAAGTALMLDRTTTETGRSVLRPGGYPLPVLAALAAVAAAVTGARAARALGRVDRAALSGGAALAGSATAAAVSVDPSQLYDFVELRRLRRVGRVKPRPLPRFARGGPGATLLTADLRRLARRPAALVRAACLLLAVYAAGIVLAGDPVTLLRVLAGYAAVNGLAGGLRAVSRSPALRRMLGSTDGTLRTVQLAVPAMGAVVWTAATVGAGRHLGGAALAVMALGLVAAVYRTATRPPMVYDVAWAVTPMGTVPVGLLTQILRGPDVAIVLAVLCAFVL